MRGVALEVPLRLLALGRRGERRDPPHARARALRDALDDTALAGGVAAFEDHDDLRALDLHPLLHEHELALQAPELLLERRAVELLLLRGLVGVRHGDPQSRRATGYPQVLYRESARAVGHVTSVSPAATMNVAAHSWSVLSHARRRTSRPSFS